MSMARIIEAIQQAIRDGEQSCYRIAQETGIDKSRLSRLMSGERSLGVDAAERLAEYLGLEITIKPRGRRGKGKQ